MNGIFLPNQFSGHTTTAGWSKRRVQQLGGWRTECSMASKLIFAERYIGKARVSSLRIMHVFP